MNVQFIQFIQFIQLLLYIKFSYEIINSPQFLLRLLTEAWWSLNIDLRCASRRTYGIYNNLTPVSNDLIFHGKNNTLGGFAIAFREVSDRESFDYFWLWLDLKRSLTQRTDAQLYVLRSLTLNEINLELII